MKSELLYSNLTIDSVLLSIVIPTYKRSDYLLFALKSIVNQKNTNFDDYEVIIVNNDPIDKMDNLIENIKKMNINVSIYSNNENYGQIGNINQGVLLSKGKYVAFLHDDDLLNNNYFANILPYLNPQNSFSCIIPSQLELFDEYRMDYKRILVKIMSCIRYLYRTEYREIKYKDCLYSFRDVYNPPSCGTVFFKQALIEFGMFKEKRGAAWDYYNFREFNKKYRIILLHKYLGIRRMDTGMSNNDKVKKDFYDDEINLINENKDNFFIKHFAYNYVEKKGYRYILVRLFRAVYLYFTNLDGIKGINKRMYNSIMREEKSNE